MVPFLPLTTSSSLMRWLATAQRCRSGTDIHARSSDDTRRFEGGVTSDTSGYSAWSPNTCFIKANILIDSNGRARLADFGLLTIISDSTNSTTASSSSSGGSTRWMSPELFAPEKFGLKDKRRTKESDCYAFAMVILEVLTGQVPFSRYEWFVVPGKVVKGKRPERPQGPEAAWFTDDLWEMLERCWSPDMKLRPAVEAVLGCLESSSMAWRPLPPSADDDFQLDDDHDSFSAMSHLSRMSINLNLDLRLPTKLSANQMIPQEGDEPLDSLRSSPHEQLAAVRSFTPDSVGTPHPIRSRPGQETDTVISSRIYSGMNATPPRFGSPLWNTSLPADKPGSPSQKPPSPRPSLIIPVNADTSSMRIPLIKQFLQPTETVPNMIRRHHKGSSSDPRARGIGGIVPHNPPGSSRPSPYPNQSASPPVSMPAYGYPSYGGIGEVSQQSHLPEIRSTLNSQPAFNMVVSRPNITTTAMAEASEWQRKTDANFACPAPRCRSTFTMLSDLKGMLSCP